MCTSAQFYVISYFHSPPVIKFGADGRLLCKCCFPSKSQPEALVFRTQLQNISSHFLREDQITKMCLSDISWPFRWLTVSVFLQTVGSCAARDADKHTHTQFIYAQTYTGKNNGVVVHREYLLVCYTSSECSERRTDLSLSKCKRSRGKLFLAILPSSGSSFSWCWVGLVKWDENFKQLSVVNEIPHFLIALRLI